MNKIKSGIILLLTFFVPFSFFPFFQNFISVNIVYVLAFSALLLVVISFLQLLTSKKLILQKKPLDIPVIIFLSAIFLSFITTSTNKTQALLDPNFGLLMMISLVVLYFYFSRMKGDHKGSPLQILSLAGFIISSFIIILSLEPTKGIGVIPLDLLVFLGFTGIYSLGSLIASFSHDEQAPKKVAHICISLIVSLAIIIGCIAFSKQGTIFPSFSLSFKALFEPMKHPLSALFGSGLDNYSVVFTRIKDVGYNQTNLWQLSAPNADRSALFHIATTTGLVCLTSFLYLIFSLIKKIKQDLSIMLSFVYVIVVLVIFPPSPLIFFLLFFLASQEEEATLRVFSFSKSFSLYSYAILIITACVLFGSAARYLSSLYLADTFYTQSFVGMQENKFNKVYDNQKKALSYNPYAEQYHLSFARTHYILAQNVINKAASGSAPLVFTKESKGMLIEAIQFAITENQATIDLNSKKAEYWASLAQIYALIPKELQAPNETEANSPQAAALAYFKKALSLDPNNPVYNFEIGQTYLKQNKMTDGFAYIKKATEVKQNWADAHYQLGKLYMQKNDIEKGTKELESALDNLDPKTNQKEYDMVKQELEKLKAGGAPRQTAPVEPAPAP